MSRNLIAFFAGTTLCLCTTVLSAQPPTGEQQSERQMGPPPEVIAAWENGEGHLLPGPPAWVLEARAGAGERSDGMPPWVAARHAMAAELGFPGPPAEVIEAWENGSGFDLPGPPEFVLDLFLLSGPQG